MNNRQRSAVSSILRRTGVEPLTTVLAALRANHWYIRPYGTDRYLCRCPAHDDRHPSLSIRITNDGTVLLKCHAGCATRNILDNLGLKFCDLFPRRTRP
jgi:hypothetical protein